MKKDGKIVSGDTVRCEGSYSNWARVEFYITESGTYTLSRTATTQTGGVSWEDTTVYVYPVRECGATIWASSTNVSLYMTGTKSQTVSLKVKSDRENGKPNPDTFHYRISQSNSDIVSASLGDWYISSDGYDTTNLIITGKKGGETSVTISLREGNTDEKIDEITVNIFVGPKYTINYNANGGSSAPSSQTFYYGDNMVLRSEKPVRQGYDFLGWSTDRNAETATYFPGDDYRETQSAVLYAVWKSNENKDLSQAAVTLSQTSYTYDGGEKTPDVTVNLNGNILKRDTDYSVRYRNNKNAGTAIVEVTGKGDYSGNKTVDFTIVPKVIDNLTVELEADSYTYDGTEKRPSVTVKDGFASLVNGTDYTVSYLNNINPGNATVRIMGSGNYSGNKEVGFVIIEDSQKSRYLSEEEIYSFANSRDHFGYKDYYIKDNDFRKLSNYVKQIYKNDSSRADSIINRMQYMRFSDWSGSCYGMAVTTMLDKQNAIGFNENFDPSAKTMRDVQSPSRNTEVKSAINYYQVSQVIPYLQYTNCHCYENNKSDWKAGLKQLVKMSQEGEPILFCYYFKRGQYAYGHAIVIKGYEKADDGSHNIIAYDNRYPREDIIIKIDAGYSSCLVNGVENAYGIEYIKNMGAFDAVDIDGPNNKYLDFGTIESSMTYDDAAKNQTIITVKLSDEISVENAEGRILNINQGDYSGSMDVNDTRLMVSSSESGEDGSCIVFTVEDSESFTFESDKKEMSVSIQSSEYFGSAEVKGAGFVVFSKKDGISALGSNINYSMAWSVNDKICDMVKIEGISDSDVKLKRTEEGIMADGVDQKSGKVQVFSNIVDVDNYSYESGYDSLMVSAGTSGNVGDIAILGSSKENNVYDVSIGSLTRETEVCTEHSWSDWIFDSKTHWNKCIKCDEIINESEHEFKWVTDKEATSVETGIKHEECGICGYKRNENTIIEKKNGTGDTKNPTGTVSQQEEKIDISKAIITGLKISGYTYMGKSIEPSVEVILNGKSISKNGYSISYSNNKNVGVALIKIDGKGNYKGTIIKQFIICPKGTGLKNLSAGKKKMTVKWKKQTAQTTGYQIQYSMKKSMNSAKTKTVKNGNNTSLTIKKLKSKKTYYVRIRTYKKLKGKNYVSAWSKVKSVKIK